MMAHYWHGGDEPLRRPLFQDQSTVLVDDDDLFNDAILFLNRPDDAHSDCSDAFSAQCPEEMVAYQQYEHVDWAAPNKSFQAQLAEASFPSSLKLEPQETTALFVDTTASLTFDSLRESVPVPVCSLSPSTKPTTPPRRINKRRLEIDQLRIESQTLEKRLSHLQDQPTDAATSSPVNRLFGDVLGSAWQNIAARQLEQRQRSETENRRLRNVLNEHKRMAKALRRLVARHANAKAWNPLRPSTRPHSTTHTRAGSFDAMDDPAVFQELAKTLTTMYQQTDVVLANPKLATNEAFVSDVTTDVDSDHHTMRVQVLGARTLPFSPTATSEAVWNHTLHHCGPQVVQWAPTQDPCTFQTDFVADSDMHDLKGLGRVKMLLRRIDEPTRVIILRSAFYQCPNADDDVAGLRRPMRHCMWKIIQKPVYVNPQDFHNDVCQIVSCELFMPTLELEGLDRAGRDVQIETLAAMCTQISTIHSKHADETIDNRLLLLSLDSPGGCDTKASYRE